MNNSYFHAQLINPNQQTLEMYEVIHFNTLLQHSADISYDGTSGLILVNTPGLYYAEWSITTGDGLFTHSSELSITATPDGQPAGTETHIQGTINGSAVFSINDKSSIMLINKSPLYQLANNGVIVNIVIYSLAADTSTSKIAITYSNSVNSAIAGVGADGHSNMVGVLGSGSCNPDVPVSSDNHIQIGHGDYNQFLYSFPFDVKLTAISGVFTTKTGIDVYYPSTTILKPFTAIALPDTKPASGEIDLLLRIQEGSKTYPADASFSDSYPGTMLYADRNDLQIYIEKNTPFAIIGGIASVGTTHQALTDAIYYNGSLIFEAIA